jgi:hypothetical protein
MSGVPTWRYLVRVREWREQVGIVEAGSPEEAKAIGLQRWKADSDDSEFTTEDCGLISVAAEDY